MVRSALLATRLEFSAEPFELARGQFLDRLALGLQPAPQPFGQVVRVGSHVRTAILSTATGSRSWDPAPSGSSCPGAAPPGRLLQGGDDIGPVPYRAVLDTLEQVVADQVAGGGLEREAGTQVRRLDVGAVPGLLHPRPRRVIRPAPAPVRR